jgi:hypothetical protein
VISTTIFVLLSKHRVRDAIRMGRRFTQRDPGFPDPSRESADGRSQGVRSDHSEAESRG